MLISLQIYKIIHFLALSLLVGGTFTSFLMELRKQDSFVAKHLVAAPGLVLLIMTGLAQSFLHNWSEFKGAGYMHAKVLLVLFAAVFLALDIKTSAAKWAFLGFLCQIGIITLIVLRAF